MTPTRPIDFLAVDRQLVALAKHFKVPVPKVAWNHGNKDVDSYRYKTQEIRFHQHNRTLWTIEQSVVHEFAHHLVGQRYHPRPRRHHGVQFKAALIAVVIAWYGVEHTDRYCWHLEYKSLRPLQAVANRRRS